MFNAIIIENVNINLMFLGLGAIVIGGIGLLLSSRSRKRRLQHSLAHEYSDLTGFRELMWTSVREAYSHFTAHREHAPSQIEALLEVVGMPPDVGYRKGRDLIHWPVENVIRLNLDQRTLWEFVTLVYPPRNNRQGKITDYSMIASNKAILFHEARGKLAHYWNRAAQATSPDFFVRNYSSAKLDLFLLSWFDIALKQWSKDPDEGKVAMFRLGLCMSGKNNGA